MNLAIDSATLKRLVGIRAMGESQIRPVGLEADRLGRPTGWDAPPRPTMISSNCCSRSGSDVRVGRAKK
ncbi:MAG: hypothetical protein JRG89_19865 [Deltaproteobacteria bacterium]|nr:hypothetical protein [Deltaproteobacteria bacterium]